MNAHAQKLFEQHAHVGCFLSPSLPRPVRPNSHGAVCVGESDVLRDDPDHLHSVWTLQPHLAFTKVDGGAQSCQRCLRLRDAEHLEFLDGEVTLLLFLRLFIPTRHPPVPSLVEADAWDLALLRLHHSSQSLVVQVELCLHGPAGDDLVLRRDGCTQCGE